MYVPCSWDGIINTIKMYTVPIVIYRFKAIPIEVRMTYFTYMEQTFEKNVYFASLG